MSKGYREIPLTRGLVAIVDDEDYEELSKYRWHASSKGYARRREYVNGKYVNILMHRQITGFALTDHADGKGWNNRRANLRNADNSLNNLNSVARAASGFKGVTRGKSGKWRAECAAKKGFDPPGRRKVHLGSNFDTPEQAARIVDEALRERWKGWASTNFPKPGERPARAKTMRGVSPPGFRPPPRGFQRTRHGGSSNFIGVYWDKTNGRWVARCRAKEGFDSGKPGTKNLGKYAKEIEAAHKADEGTRKRWGKDGWYNFPGPGEFDGINAVWVPDE